MDPYERGVLGEGPALAPQLPAQNRLDATPSPRLAEAALVGVPHDVEGSALYAFVTLTQDAETRPVVEIGSISTRPPAGASRRALDEEPMCLGFGALVVALGAKTLLKRP